MEKEDNDSRWNHLIQPENIPLDIKVEEWVRCAGPEGLTHARLHELGKKEDYAVKQVNDMIFHLRGAGLVHKGGDAWRHKDHIYQDPNAALKNLLYGTGVEPWRETGLDGLRAALGSALGAQDRIIGPDEISDLFGPR